MTGEEQLSWRPPHDRLPYDRTLGFINPVVIAQSAYHPTVELYANSFMLIGESLIYADETRTKDMLHFGCPVTQQGGTAILQCPTPADAMFASRFGLKAGYAYNLGALADQLEAGGMVRLPPAVVEASAAGRLSRF